MHYDNLLFIKKIYIEPVIHSGKAIKGALYTSRNDVKYRIVKNRTSISEQRYKDNKSHTWQDCAHTQRPNNRLTEINRLD